MSRRAPLKAHRELVNLAELKSSRTRRLVFPDDDGSENGDIPQMHGGVLREPRGRESDCFKCLGCSLRSRHHGAARMKEEDTIHGSCCGEERAGESRPGDSVRSESTAESM